MEQMIWSFLWSVARDAFLLSVLVGSLLYLLISSKPPSPSSGSSSTQVPLPPGDYEVFLNFRGADVRYSFANTLNTFLLKYGIRTFFDETEIREGEEMDPKLIKSIEQSKIYIPIFSPAYASSWWCLRELAHMVKCYEHGKGHIILPIFYMVKTGDVMHQQGPFEKSFRQLAEKYDSETITEWKKALKTVGELKGWTVSPSTRQGDTIDEVFSLVRSHLMENYKLVTGQLVGIDPHIKQVKRLLKKGVKLVGIQGMSGMGKTIIARAVYNSVSAYFDRCCFVEDVRDILSKSDGIITLQNKILSDILRCHTKVRDSSQGIQSIKDRVCCWDNILIVLDNVDERFVFADTLGDLTHFRSNSRFIITTVDERVFQKFQEYELYQPKGMNPDIALQPISRHAFGSDYPPQDYISRSENFVKVASGLPLAVKAIGSLLFRKDDSFWDAMWPRLQDIPAIEVQKRLKIIYMELTPEEKHIFLDIACYFIGEPYDQSSYLWSDSNLHALIAIDTLCLKSLIKINERNEFWMHDQYKILGRDIVREEDILKPWKRSRMWSNEEVLDMLRDKEGTERLEVLRVDMRGEDFELTLKEFQKLSGLRYLEVYSGRLTGDFRKILPNLRWLRLHGCRSIHNAFNVNKLVILDLHRCPVSDDWKSWKGIKEGHRLKVINVSFSYKMRKVPDLCGCRSLEQINFSYCSEMGGELHIGNFKNLRVLDIAMTKITKLTGDIGILQNLQEIRAANSSLREIPAGIGKLSSLEILDLGELQIEVPELPTSLKQLTLSSPRVPNLLKLENLEKLSLICDGRKIPGNMWKLSKLKDLALLEVGNGEDALDPNDQNNNSRPTLPSSLNTLLIWGCEPLERLPNLANLGNLMKLDLRDIGVHEIAGLGELRMLENFQLWNASSLLNLDCLEHLELLKNLWVNGCPLLRELPSFSNLTKLQELRIFDCPLLSEIQGLGELVEISTLLIDGCLQLTRVIGLDELDSLQLLEIRNCASIDKLTDVSALQHLQELKIMRCNQLTEVMGIERLESLQVLEIRDCALIKKLPNLSALEHLLKLKIMGCNQLIEVIAIDKLESLQLLRITDCSSIKKLPDLSALKRLRKLKITRCNQLTGVKGLDQLESLQLLRITDCASIKKLPGLSALEQLRELTITGCNQLTEVTGLDQLESLQLLSISDCASIKKLPGLSALEHLRELTIAGCNQLTEITGIERLQWLKDVVQFDTRRRMRHISEKTRRFG
ncbi:unnamed protein product [Linum trigynum]|uniref:TIR domain-containing protein n=1 Tax=Linum trigynum TaxID=586398 RepID=A0AAV2CPZ0_9ROSI